MLNADSLGYIATSLNIVMMIPQLSRTWKTRETKDLSLATLIIFTVACLLWIIYGISKAATPIIIANTVIGASNLFLIILKLKSK